MANGHSFADAPTPLPWMTSFQARVYRHPAFRGHVALPLRADPYACWVWTAARVAAGYGRRRWDGKVWWAHRLARFVAFGDLPEAACHHCDNPPCVNPEHLRAGTLSDNTAEMWAKGRARVFPKLTLDQARQIRAARASQNIPADLFAAHYGVSKRTIYRVLFSDEKCYRDAELQAAA